MIWWQDDSFLFLLKHFNRSSQFFTKQTVPCVINMFVNAFLMAPIILSITDKGKSWYTFCWQILASASSDKRQSCTRFHEMIVVVFFSLAWNVHLHQWVQPKDEPARDGSFDNHCTLSGGAAQTWAEGRGRAEVIRGHSAGTVQRS